MFDRKILKERGKAAFKGNYWPSVLAGFVGVTLPALLLGGGGGYSSTSSSATATVTVDGQTQQAVATFNSLTPEQQAAAATAVGAVVGGFLLIGIVISILVSIFLSNPLTLGGSRFFLVNSATPAKFGEVGYGFKPHYGKKVKVMFGMYLRIALWSLLLIVPGIIKAFEYRMVPYLLAEDDSFTTKEYLEKSKAMMDGNKWAAFVLDLSFIGWHLLGCLTLGLVDLFYTVPYQAATSAELFVELNGRPPVPTEAPVPAE